jgi:Protein of unknown function (DUF2865)
VAHSHRNKPWQWRAVIVLGVLSAAALPLVTGSARAGGLFDFLFGGFPPGNAVPSTVNSYAEPSAPAAAVATVAPLPGAPESSHPSGGGGRIAAYCVRLCDGEHFPLAHLARATPVQTCRAMCPASKTRVFFGSEIDHAVARDGARYADLANAYLYRKRLVAGCTCNGKDVFGLAPIDLSRDPTLRRGDIVATAKGFVAFSGKARGRNAKFTPVDPATLKAAFNSTAPRVRLTGRIAAPRPGETLVDEVTTIVPPRPVWRGQASR